MRCNYCVVTSKLRNKKYGGDQLTNEELARANKLKKEIYDLDIFIALASMAWEGKIVRREQKYLFKTIPYGVVDESAFKLDGDIKNKVLDVLRDYLSEIKEELGRI